MVYISYMTTQHDIRAADTGRICVNIIITIVWGCFSIYDDEHQQQQRQRGREGERKRNEFI